MQHYKVRQIFPWLYSIKEIDVFCYLIIGNEKALLFDSCYGIYDLRGVVESITDKPYSVILGHGHLDHANGAPWFDSALLHEADFGIYTEHTSVKYRKSIINKSRADGLGPPDDYDKEKYANMKQSCLKPLDTKKSIDLGSLNIDIIEMPGHTGGSIGLLIREHNLLLTSDSACSNMWLFLNESLPLNSYIKMLERVVKLPFDAFVVAHFDDVVDKSVFFKYIKAAKNVDASKSTCFAPFKKDIPVTGLLYEEDGVGIIYNPNKID